MVTWKPSNRLELKQPTSSEPRCMADIFSYHRAAYHVLPESIKIILARLTVKHVVLVPRLQEVYRYVKHVVRDMLEMMVLVIFVQKVNILQQVPLVVPPVKVDILPRQMACLRVLNVLVVNIRSLINLSA